MHISEGEVFQKLAMCKTFEAEINSNHETRVHTHMQGIDRLCGSALYVDRYQEIMALKRL